MLLNDENNRLAALRSFAVLDSPREDDFDKITTMGARLFDTALTCITLVDKDRFFFKSMSGADLRNMDRRSGFCDTAIQSTGVHCIEDATTDPLVQDHPLVCDEPYIRSYAGAPLITSDGFAIGTLCVMDTEVRQFSSSERLLLQDLADFVMFHLDRRRLQAEAQKHDEKRRNIQKLESLGLLSGEIAHDFNNLLVGMLGNASLAARQIDKDSPAQESVADIIRAANQASELTGQLLAYAGQRPTRPKPIDMIDLISEMSPLLRSSIGTNASFEVGHTVDLPRVIGDPTQLRQIILNLVTNASDAYCGRSGLVRLNVDPIELGTSEAGEGSLTYLQPGSYLRVEVVDEGCGMDAETRDSAFSPFFTTKAAGRGLGMSIVQRIIRSHGGYIQIESELGEGSTVCFLLPADTTSKLAIEDKVATDAATIAGSGSVLVVDDEEIVIRMTTSALRTFGYEVRTATSGEAAVEYAKGGDDFGVVILDATMPGMNGAATLDAINDYRPDLPTIITTGHHIDEVADQFEQFRNLTYLQKPWTLEQLSIALQTATTCQRTDPGVRATAGALPT